MKKIPLTQGKFAIVDDRDFDKVSGISWFFHDRGYACNRSKIVNGKKVTRWMHRLVMDAPAGMQVDHINGDKLDNRRSNLRLATNSQNHQNMGISRGNTSGYKGVFRLRDTNRWFSVIKLLEKTKFLGVHKTKEAAARAYDKAARENFGEFARTNFDD